MINLSFFIYLFSINVIPTLANRNQSLENLRAPVRNSSIFDSSHINFDQYQTSWQFIDRNTVRVSFHVDRQLLQKSSIIFTVRHVSSRSQQSYVENNQINDSNVTIYLSNLKHGRHIVCLVLFRPKRPKRPVNMFCQEINFNFRKYGLHDTDNEPSGNSIFFLLTQYAIVCVMLITLQIVYAARKRRFLRILYKKANALRQSMLDYHRRFSEARQNNNNDGINPNSVLACLIYNLDRNILYNFNEDEEKSDNDMKDRHSRLNDEFKFRRRSTLVKIDDEEPSVSFRSISHILEDSKPWVSRLSDNGTVESSVLLSKSKSSFSANNHRENV